MERRHALVIFCVFSAASGVLPAREPDPERPRNIVLMIGDGMGLAQISAVRYHKGRLEVARMPYAGFSFTHSLKHMVTDSSASATALATGYPIVNGQVGILPDGTRLKTILEYAEERGMWTGLVATSRITHATPASMAAHVKSRSQEDEIAVQLAQAGIEVILGGGWDKFLPARRIEVRAPEPPRPSRAAGETKTGSRVASRLRTRRDSDPPPARKAGATSGVLTGAAAGDPPLVDPEGRPYGTRRDGRNLVTEMEKEGYAFVRTAGELAVAVDGHRDRILGLFHSGPMPKVVEGRSPSLQAMALAALRVLSRSPKGFFVMIEGSQIDWGGHANDFTYMLAEANEFDATVGEVLRFLDENGLADDTLVVVTADHETGGLALPAHPHLPGAFEPRWTTTSHTAVPVPVFASGKGAERFSGVLTHPLIGRRLIRLLEGPEVRFPYPPAGVPARAVQPGRAQAGGGRAAAAQASGVQAAGSAAGGSEAREAASRSEEPGP